MYENNKNDTALSNRLVKAFCDPVLIYTVIVMMSIMYHYREQLTAVYGIAALITGFLVFRVYDFISSHKLLGVVCFPAISIGFLYAAKLCADIGADTYPLSFSVWFLTPQRAMDYSKWYTIAIFLLFMYFMSTVIYYFTRVRYRLFMNFLIFIIPFVLYGKEYEKMPTVFIILLAVGFILLMVYFRQLKENDKTVIVAKKSIWKSVGIYTVIFASVSSILPKPHIEADRDVIETLISAERFTDNLTAMLDVFRDTATGNRFRQTTYEIPLFYVNAQESLRLKTSTFTDYNFNGDTWSASDMDMEIDDKTDEGFLNIASTGELTDAIMYAARLDSSFAEKYGLQEYVDSELYAPETREMKIYIIENTRYVPVPQLAEVLTDTTFGGNLSLSETGVIKGTSGTFNQDDSFTFNYSAETYFRNTVNRDFVAEMSDDEYIQLLSDAKDAVINNLSSSYVSPDTDYIIEVYDIISQEILKYQTYTEEYLNYSNSQKIYALAQEITAGLDSDYDKAKAIELYFLENDYVYDLEYVKNINDNAEDFLFETKRGVCYEYATAMVLLSRAAGIPARYCEGYSLSEQMENSKQNTNYVITPKSAHGFPELYIRGFGWMSFEPTVSAEAEAQTDNSATLMLMIAGLIILAAAVLIIIFVLLYPMLSHKLFIFRYSRKIPAEGAIAIMQRICRLYEISGVNTSHEVKELVYKISGADISNVVKLFDAAAYGGDELSDEEKQKALEEYISAYEALRETKRNKRITAKKV